MESEIIAIELSPNAEELFRRAFAELDKNQTGSLDAVEFATFMETCGQKNVSKYLFRIIDRNRSGAVSLEEFLAFGRTLWDIRESGDMTRYLKLLFDASDQGNKGYLTRLEFFRFLKYTGSRDKWWKKLGLFKEFDADGNGKIAFDEIIQNIRFHIAG
jgi:Ca2+-binding EF-hand superfamily protein